MKTPIDVWPARRFRGRPGYSAAHFSALAGEPNDPLTVATRIATRCAADVIAEQTQKRFKAGESWSVVTEWQSSALTQSAAEVYERLKGSFDAVIEVLSASNRAGIRALARQVRRAQKEAERQKQRVS